MEVTAGRSVLAARSSVFKAMLFGKFEVANTDEVNFPEFGEITLKGLVEYI